MLLYVNKHGHFKVQRLSNGTLDDKNTRAQDAVQLEKLKSMLAENRKILIQKNRVLYM